MAKENPEGRRRCSLSDVAGVEDFVDHLTPAFRYLQQEECNPRAHTVATWCGLKGQVQDMLDAGMDPTSGQLSPGIWMNRCATTLQFPTGITEQGWTEASFTEFLAYLDTVGVRSVDMWTSLLSKNDLETCDWFLPSLKKWRAGSGRFLKTDDPAGSLLLTDPGRIGVFEIDRCFDTSIYQPE